MTFNYALAPVFNRGNPTTSFLTELVDNFCVVPDNVFTPDTERDVFGKIVAELGPFNNLKHRRAAMCEVMRVLAGFESSWDWKEGVDTSRLGVDTPENAEAGAWQISYDSRKLHPKLLAMLQNRGISNGVKFQQEMKFNHGFAVEYTARLLSHNAKHNGPLYKGGERNAIRKSLRGAEHSIYPWLSRHAVTEFLQLL